MLAPLVVGDPGGQKPHGEPLRVGLDPESDEFVDIWFQDDKSKNDRVLASLNNRSGGICGWGYAMRRSGGACRGEGGGPRAPQHPHVSRVALPFRLSNI